MGTKAILRKRTFHSFKDRNHYSTDFFGFYDESTRKGRNQIAFYYSIHFHEFIRVHYREFSKVPEITRFLEACLEIQKPYGRIFDELGLELKLSILFKVIKYLPSYKVSRPHYDGTAFSLFLNSSDNQSLLLSLYKASFAIDDFFSPKRNQNSILLIPGTFLTEFSIYPTPHIVTESGITRYAAIAFAMRDQYAPPKLEFSELPNFNH